MSRIRVDPFVLSLILAVALAYFFPEWANPERGLRLDLVASIGIGLIFFFYGLKLGPEKLRAGLRNWKLHVLVQLSTFLVFPMIVLAFYPLLDGGLSRDYWLAFLFLAALPSTVSASVVMASVAGGNVPGAIFNASISGLIGVVVTPLWMGFFLKQAEGDFELGEVYFKLFTQILLPVIIGLFLQRYLERQVNKHSHRLALFDKLIILLIIYKSFASSFENGVFVSVSWSSLALLFLGVVLLFFFMFFLIGFISKKLKFNDEDRTTAQFCGSKKSLVHGTVFAKILFPIGAPIGLIFLPLMLYHAFQILTVSVIASKRGRSKLKINDVSA